MREISIIPTLLFLSMLCIGCYSAGFASTKNGNSDSDSKIISRNDQYSHYICYIHPGESRDTTVTMERDNATDFNHILRQIYDIQRIGRENMKDESDPYNWKFSVIKDYPDMRGDERNPFTINRDNDTIYVIEDIFGHPPSPSYYLEYGRNFKNLNQLKVMMELFMDKDGKIFQPDPLRGIKAIDVSDREAYKMINSWQKDSLLKWGKSMMPPVDGGFNSNPHSTCVSRIILSPDSARIDMIKYYKLYKLFYPHKYSDY